MTSRVSYGLLAFVPFAAACGGANASPLRASGDAGSDAGGMIKDEAGVTAESGTDAAPEAAPDSGGICTPSCGGKSCGQGDGCGGQCDQGSCAASEHCAAGACTQTLLLF